MNVFVYCHYIREENDIIVFLGVMTILHNDTGGFQVTVQHGRRLNLTLEPRGTAAVVTTELGSSSDQASDRSFLDQDPPSTVPSDSSEETPSAGPVSR